MFIFLSFLNSKCSCRNTKCANFWSGTESRQHLSSCEGTTIHHFSTKWQTGSVCLPCQLSEEDALTTQARKGNKILDLPPGQQAQNEAQTENIWRVCFKITRVNDDLVPTISLKKNLKHVLELYLDMDMDMDMAIAIALHPNRIADTESIDQRKSQLVFKESMNNLLSSFSQAIYETNWRKMVLCETTNVLHLWTKFYYGGIQKLHITMNSDGSVIFFLKYQTQNWTELVMLNISKSSKKICSRL